MGVEAKQTKADTPRPTYVPFPSTLDDVRSALFPLAPALTESEHLLPSFAALTRSRSAEFAHTVCRPANVASLSHSHFYTLRWRLRGLTLFIFSSTTSIHGASLLDERREGRRPCLAWRCRLGAVQLRCRIVTADRGSPSNRVLHRVP